MTHLHADGSGPLGREQLRMPEEENGRELPNKLLE